LKIGPQGEQQRNRNECDHQKKNKTFLHGALLHMDENLIAHKKNPRQILNRSFSLQFVHPLM
jgi:hypothetical protein